MKLLLIDLDDTLIDTTRFKESLLTVFAKRCSIDKQNVSEVYENVKEKAHWPQLFIDHFAQACSIPSLELSEVFYSCLKDIQVKQSALNYLQNFKGKKIILTFGDEELQLRKIRTFELQKYADEVLTTLEKKPKFLSKFIENETFIFEGVPYKEAEFVDNSEKTLSEIHNQYPWIKTIDVKNLV